MHDLNELLAWVDSHINYERSGPGQAAGGQPKDHDPQVRLDQMRSFMELMDNPQTAFPSIHITGTNGKTSTSRLISSLLSAQGLTTGTYTSPHLEKVNERIVTNGEAISDADLAEVLEAMRLLEPLGEAKLSYFELLTAAGLRHFADRPVEAGIIEVGVGGTYDATNVVDGVVAVATNIGLDHTNYLGPTHADIARHKAGIVKPDAALVLGDVEAQLADIFKARPHGSSFSLNHEFGVERNEVAVGGRLLDLRTPKARYAEVFLSLHGQHQGVNASVALMAAEAFFDAPLPDDVVRQAFGSVTSPGRMEIVHRQPLCLVDGAHNAEGAATLIASLDEEFEAVGGRVLVVGMLSPHDPTQMLSELQADKARLVIACEPEWPRAIPAEQIADAAKALGATAVVVRNVAQAVHEGLATAADDEMVLVTGSLYVVGAARGAMASIELP